MVRMRKAAQARGEKLRMTITPAAISTNKVANSCGFIVRTVYGEKTLVSIRKGLRCAVGSL